MEHIPRVVADGRRVVGAIPRVVGLLCNVVAVIPRVVEGWWSVVAALRSDEEGGMNVFFVFPFRCAVGRGEGCDEEQNRPLQLEAGGWDEDKGRAPSL